jgi:hypothetical protein
MRCWEKLDWAVWRWISARCILSIELIASGFFSYRLGAIERMPDGK